MDTTDRTDSKKAKRTKLTHDQRARVRSLVADEGYTRTEAIALVLAGVA